MSIEDAILLDRDHMMMKTVLIRTYWQVKSGNSRLSQTPCALARIAACIILAISAAGCSDLNFLQDGGPCTIISEQPARIFAAQAPLLSPISSGSTFYLSIWAYESPWELPEIWLSSPSAYNEIYVSGRAKVTKSNPFANGECPLGAYPPVGKKYDFPLTLPSGTYSVIIEKDCFAEKPQKSPDQAPAAAREMQFTVTGRKLFDP